MLLAKKNFTRQALWLATLLHDIFAIWGAHISQHLNSVIFHKFCILNHFNFVLLSDTKFTSLAMLLKHVFKFLKLTLSKVQ